MGAFVYHIPFVRRGGGGGGGNNYIERSSMATDLNFSGCHYINGIYASDLAGEE